MRGRALTSRMGSLFTHCVDYEKAKRIWDILLLEGPFGIVKIAMGILSLFSSQLTDMKAKDIYAFLHRLPEDMDIEELASSVRRKVED